MCRPVAQRRDRRTTTRSSPVNSPVTPTMQLQWTVSFRASCLHAAEAFAHGQLIVDPLLAEAVTDPAQGLRQAIQAAGLPRTEFWRNLTGLAPLTDGLRDLVERAVTQTIGSARAAAVADTLVPSIGDLESSVRQALPNLLDELSLRLLPLREQWEAQGPGLLQSVARWTDPRMVVPDARVVLVHPALGGGGSAHLRLNSVHLEAVLTNPVPQLPENLRLAWLLAQLGLDRPVFRDQIAGSRRPDVAALAMLPVTLQAAQDAGLVLRGIALIDLALSAWQVLTPTHLVDPADVLERWWATCLETHPRWEIALTALDRMLG